MADDLTKRGGQDRKRISLTEEWELRYWTDALGISEARLREVVADVGDMAADVRAFLDAHDC
jgi:hypothetical protein